MIFINSGTNLVKARKSGSTITLGTFAAEMGHLPTAGGTMTGVINMNSNKITNVTQGATGTNEAATVLQVEGRLYRGGDTLTPANAFLKYTSPVNEALYDDLTLVAKHYVDTKVIKSGDTGISGRLAYSTTFGSSASTDILRKDEIENLTTFNTTIGHRHDGTNSRRVLATDLNTTGEAAYRSPVANGTGVIVFEDTHGPNVLNDSIGSTFFTTSVSDGGFVDIDVSGSVPAEVRSRQQIAILRVSFTLSSSGTGTRTVQLELRAGGGSGSTLYKYTSNVNGASFIYILQILVPLSVSRHFEKKVTISDAGSVQADFLGYFTNP